MESVKRQKRDVMNEAILKRDETQTLLFGFSATDLCKDFRKEVHVVISKTVALVEKTFIEVEPQDVIIEEQIEKPIQNLRDIYLMRAEPVINQFENEIEHMFTVPDNVPLPLPGVKERILSQEELDQELSEVIALQEQLLRERAFVCKLRQQQTFINEHVEGLRQQIKDTCQSVKTALSSRQDADRERLQNLLLFLQTTLDSLESDCNSNDLVLRNSVEQSNFFSSLNH